MPTYIIQLSIPVKGVETDDDAYDIAEGMLEHLNETYNDDDSLDLTDAYIKYFKKGNPS